MSLSSKNQNQFFCFIISNKNVSAQTELNICIELKKYYIIKQSINLLS